MRLGLLIYNSLDTLSGGYLYDRRLVESLRAMGDTVEIISLPWRSYPAHLVDNLTFRLPDVVAKNEATKQPPRPKHHPHPQKIDLLIQDELNHPSLLAANARRYPYPIVSLVHHLRSSEQRPAWQNSLYRLVEKRYLRGVDGFIYNSQTTKDSVTDLTGNGKPSIIAYPPTDRFGLRVTGEEVTRRAQSAELRILFLGNVIERKGLHTILDALTPLSPDFHLDVVGSLSSEPAYAGRMQRKAMVISRTSRSAPRASTPITFHSLLDNEPLIAILKAAHVLVVPSSYEGFGIVYLEGMGFGLPAISTSAGATREIITDGVDGFLIPPGDAASLRDRLSLLATDRSILVRMSLAARERFLRQTPWEQTATSIRKFLQGML